MPLEVEVLSNRERLDNILQKLRDNLEQENLTRQQQQEILMLILEFLSSRQLLSPSLQEEIDTTSEKFYSCETILSSPLNFFNYLKEIGCDNLEPVNEYRLPDFQLWNEYVSQFLEIMAEYQSHSIGITYFHIEKLEELQRDNENALQFLRFISSRDAVRIMLQNMLDEYQLIADELNAIIQVQNGGQRKHFSHENQVQAVFLSNLADEQTQQKLIRLGEVRSTIEQICHNSFSVLPHTALANLSTKEQVSKKIISFSFNTFSSYVSEVIHSRLSPVYVPCEARPIKIMAIFSQYSSMFENITIDALSKAIEEIKIEYNNSHSQLLSVVTNMEWKRDPADHNKRIATYPQEYTYYAVGVKVSSYEDINPKTAYISIKRYDLETKTWVICVENIFSEELTFDNVEQWHELAQNTCCTVYDGSSLDLCFANLSLDCYYDIANNRLILGGHGSGHLYANPSSYISHYVMKQKLPDTEVIFLEHQGKMEQKVIARSCNIVTPETDVFFTSRTVVNHPIYEQLCNISQQITALLLQLRTRVDRLEEERAAASQFALVPVEGRMVVAGQQQVDVYNQHQQHEFSLEERIGSSQLFL